MLELEALGRDDVPEGPDPLLLSLRVVRCTSRIPRSASSAGTLRLTDDLRTPSADAAAVELPVSTTQANAATRFRSTVASRAPVRYVPSI